MSLTGGHERRLWMTADAWDAKCRLAAFSLLQTAALQRLQSFGVGHRTHAIDQNRSYKIQALNFHNVERATPH